MGYVYSFCHNSAGVQLCLEYLVCVQAVNELRVGHENMEPFVVVVVVAAAVVVVVDVVVVIFEGGREEGSGRVAVVFFTFHCYVPLLFEVKRVFCKAIYSG